MKFEKNYNKLKYVENKTIVLVCDRISNSLNYLTFVQAFNL